MRGVIPGSEAYETTGPFPDNSCTHVTERGLFNIAFLAFNHIPSTHYLLMQLLIQDKVSYVFLTFLTFWISFLITFWILDL
jgi:hypothetical protein